jgi:hypothetical protein
LAFYPSEMQNPEGEEAAEDISHCRGCPEKAKPERELVVLVEV